MHDIVKQLLLLLLSLFLLSFTVVADMEEARAF